MKCRHCGKSGVDALFEVREEILAALAELTIALEALGEILISPVENSHGLARIAIDRIRALK